MAESACAGTVTGTMMRLSRALISLIFCVGLVAGCGGSKDYTAATDTAPTPGPKRKYDPNAPSVLGEGGFSVSSINNRNSGGLFGGGDDKARLPVNKYLWQGALDTLSFLPLASTDPFTGVIATDWGATPEAPSERLKVTAYILNPALSAASLKVAVFRETRNEAGLWVPAPVSAETARRLEDAILTRARQIRIAEVQGDSTG